MKFKNRLIPKKYGEQLSLKFISDCFLEKIVIDRITMNLSLKSKINNHLKLQTMKK